MSLQGSPRNKVKCILMFSSRLGPSASQIGMDSDVVAAMQQEIMELKRQLGQKTAESETSSFKPSPLKPTKLDERLAATLPAKPATPAALAALPAPELRGPEPSQPAEPSPVPATVPPPQAEKMNTTTHRKEYMKLAINLQ